MCCVRKVRNSKLSLGMAIKLGGKRGRTLGSLAAVVNQRRIKPEVEMILRSVTNQLYYLLYDLPLYDIFKIF